MTKKTQKTPKDHEIPIPKRSDVFKVFKNAAKPEKELDYEAKPEEEGTQIAILNRCGGCNATHIRLGSPASAFWKRNDRRHLYRAS